MKGPQAEEPLIPNLGAKVAFSLPGIPEMEGVLLQIGYRHDGTVVYDLLAEHAGWVVRAVAVHLVINPEQRDDSEPFLLADEIKDASLEAPSTLNAQEKQWWGVVSADVW